MLSCHISPRFIGSLYCILTVKALILSGLTKDCNWFKLYDRAYFFRAKLCRIIQSPHLVVNIYFIFVYLTFLSLIVLYFLHITSVLSFYIDVVLTLSIIMLAYVNHYSCLSRLSGNYALSFETDGMAILHIWTINQLSPPMYSVLPSCAIRRDTVLV